MTKHISSFFRQGAVAIALSCGALSVGASAMAADTLRIVIDSDPGYVDPAYWGSAVDQFLIDNLFPRLAKPVPGTTEWKTELDAAKSVDLSDPMQIKFELKSGIMWSGGFGELTAEDVEFSFERHSDPDLGSWVVSEFAALKDVEVTGKYTGIIHLNQPSSAFWTSTAAFTGGAIISKAAAEKSGGYFEAVPTATASAYMIKEFVPGSKIILEKNPEWNGETGDFDVIELISISDENAGELAFAAGEVDYMRTSAGNYDALLANPPAEAKIALRQTLDPLFLGITSTNESLKDIRVRHAIQLAVDIPTILQATTGGHQPQGTGLIGQGVPGYRDGKELVRDVEKARTLIQEAGAEGLTLNLSYTNYTQRDIAAQIIQANLAEIGISVELDGKDAAAFWGPDEAAMAEMQLTLKSWTGHWDGYYLLQYFTEEGVGVWNWEGFVNAEYDELLAKARVEPDTEKRGEMYERMQTLMEESGNFVFFGTEAFVQIVRDGIEPGALPDGRPVFHAFKKAN